MASSSVGGATSTHRKALLHSVSILCKEEGFDSASKLALETLTEMLQSCKYGLAFFFLYTLNQNI